MDLIDKLREISTRLPKQVEHLHTEEATKNALVMPFISALGYDVFNPTAVIPEFTADVGTKKGEKVDYAIMGDEGPIILIECKACDVNLDKHHADQLYRYFSVTSARFGVLTNGISYRIFSDLEEPNKMDKRPFLEFSMRDVNDELADELKKFAKGTFDLEKIVSTASELKYTKGIRRVLSDEWSNPSDDFVKLLTGRVYSGRLTQAVREQFAEITKRAFQGFVHEKIKERLTSALEGERSAEAEDDDVLTDSGDEDSGGIVTTEEEVAGCYVVKAILGNAIDIRRVSLRDQKSYCGILLDDNNRKPICRLHFNRRQKYIGLFDDEKNEMRHAIDDVNGIYQHAEALRATVAGYDGVASTKE